MNSIDRRVIYFFVLVALSLPLIFEYSVKPAKMQSADETYHLIDNLEITKGDIAFVALDFGPNTKAENEAQARVTVEHLFRKRIPVVLFSLIPVAEPFLKIIPESIAEDLAKEFPGEYWEYGKDWVNLGFRPGAGLLIQAIPKSEDLSQLFSVDAMGNSLKSLPATQNFKTLEQIKLLAEFTGSVGLMDAYLQFFLNENYRPNFIHGCTSISIPEAYIYLDSGQLSGLLEGIAGAAWYSQLLSDENSKRKKDSAILINTGLGVAHLVIIFFIILGNVLMFVRKGK